MITLNDVPFPYNISGTLFAQHGKRNKQLEIIVTVAIGSISAVYRVSVWPYTDVKFYSKITSELEIAIEWYNQIDVDDLGEVE